MSKAATAIRVRREIDRFSVSRLFNSAYKHALKLIHRDNFFVTSYYGCQFLVRMGDLVGRDIARNRYDRAQLAFFVDQLRTRQPSVFLDIGANAGLYSCIAITAGLVPVAIAFEPDRRNAATLRTNLMMNKLMDRVDVRELAIGGETTKLHFVPGPDWQTGNSHIASEAINGTGYIVDVARLDDIVNFSGRRLAIKIDVEGHEFEALAGMTRTLAENDAILQIESFSPDHLKLVMAKMGYRAIATFNHDFVFERLRL